MKLPFFLLLFALIASPLEAIRPGQVAVLYNNKDASSKKLAGTYAELRDVPAEHVVGLPMPQKEIITRDEFNKSIRDPLFNHFTQKKWWTLAKDARGAVLPQRNDIRCLVLIRGVPLGIKRSPLSPQEAKLKMQFNKNNEASVDSELAILGVRQSPLGGMQNNLYFKKDTPIGKFQAPFLLLVGRLDAAKVSTCERMLNDALEVEQHGLWGKCYLDFANRTGGYAQGEKWLESIRKQNNVAGIPTIIDRQSNTLPTNYPLQDAALYWGWYAHNRDGPFLNPALKLKRGSVITHLHSFSTAQLRDPNRNWSASILEHGAAATVGNVFEPFLSATHHFNILHDRLLKGYTLIEAAYMAMPVVSWQGVVLGDPLYRPFRLFKKPREAAKLIPAEDRPYLAMRAAALEWKDERKRLTKLRSAANRMKSGTIAEDIGFQLLEAGQYPEATKFFQSAKDLYPKPEDKLRQLLNLIEIARRTQKPNWGLQVIDVGLKEFGNQPGAKSLIGLRNIISPPPPPPAKK